MAAALRRLWFALACAVAFSALPSAAAASITVTDDSGQRLQLDHPATRIISLAPHATELLFAAGAGDRVVAVSSFSDFPPQARQLPSVGGSMQLDVERIVALRPDLVIAWKSGNNARQVERLRKLGMVVFESEPRTLDDIASTLERFGQLAGSERGRQSATEARERLRGLRATYAGREPLRVFYQIWPAPLMTLNDGHIVSDALKLCGAVNVFGKLPQLAPTISREAVLTAAPDVIIASDERGEDWHRWKSLLQLRAVRLGNLHRIDGAVMNRPGLRMLDATVDLCRMIEQSRERLAADRNTPPAPNRNKEKP